MRPAAATIVASLLLASCTTTGNVGSQVEGWCGYVAPAETIREIIAYISPAAGLGAGGALELAKRICKAVDAFKSKKSLGDPADISIRVKGPQGVKEFRLNGHFTR